MKKSAPKSRDAFDMQPFDGAKTPKGGSPIIRIPSPDEVHPTRTPSRRRTAPKQNGTFGDYARLHFVLKKVLANISGIIGTFADLAKQLFEDPLGELSRLDRQVSQTEV